MAHVPGDIERHIGDIQKAADSRNPGTHPACELLNTPDGPARGRNLVPVDEKAAVNPDLDWQRAARRAGGAVVATSKRRLAPKI